MWLRAICDECLYTADVVQSLLVSLIIFKSSVFIESIMSQLSCIRIHPCGVSQQFLCCNKYLIHLFLSKCIQARVLLSKRFLFQHFTQLHAFPLGSLPVQSQSPSAATDTNGD